MDLGWRELLNAIKDEPTKMAIKTMVEEVTKSNNGLREELEKNRQELQQQRAGGGPTTQEKWERKMAHALKTMPIYEHHQGKEKGKTWSTYLMERRDWVKIMNYDDEQDLFLKNALLYSLKGTAKDMSSVIGNEEEIGQMSCSQVLKCLTELFEPPVEGALKKQEFKSRKQAKQEDIVHYFTTKEALFTRAYPPSERNMEMLIDSTIDGICSKTVRKRMYEEKYIKKIKNFKEAREIAISVVSAERTLMQQGLSDSLNMDGLRPATISQARDGATQFVEEDEAMEIGAIGDKSCYSCGKKGHLKKECPKRASKGKKSTGKFEGDCRRCGRKGHKGQDCFAKKHKNGKELKPNKNKVRNIAEGDDAIEVESSDSE